MWAEARVYFKGKGQALLFPFVPFCWSAVLAHANTGNMLGNVEPHAGGQEGACTPRTSWSRITFLLQVSHKWEVDTCLGQARGSRSFSHTGETISESCWPPSSRLADPFLPLSLGHSHITCFDQWNVNKCSSPKGQEALLKLNLFSCAFAITLERTYQANLQFSWDGWKKCEAGPSQLCPMYIS